MGHAYSRGPSLWLNEWSVQQIVLHLRNRFDDGARDRVGDNCRPESTDGEKDLAPWFPSV